MVFQTLKGSETQAGGFMTEEYESVQNDFKHD